MPLSHSIVSDLNIHLLKVLGTNEKWYKKYMISKEIIQNLEWMLVCVKGMDPY